MGVFRKTAIILITTALAACGGNDDIVGAIDPDLDLDLIRSQLDISAPQAISLDDGAVPITSGSWARFTPQSTWNWQLNSTPDALNPSDINLEYDADVYVVDMFAQLRSDSITALHDMNRKVICYFSAGTYEFWRPDRDLFANLTLGNPHQAYPDERWMDIKDPMVAKLMANRMDMAVAIGCDGVELDNVDGWIPSANSGFTFTLEDQLQFNKVLANEAHKRGLAVALKNNVEMITDLVDYFDLVINEECFQYNECEGYRPMIASGKPVLNAEYKVFSASGDALLPVSDYPAERAALCAKSIEYGFQTLFLPIELDGTFRLTCR